MLIFQFGIFKTVQQWDTAIAVPAAARVAAFLSLTFWTLVLIFGRWIGFTLVPAIVG
jgi:sulfur relay (sulfurtransferase) DsrC/TusE family protein